MVKANRNQDFSKPSSADSGTAPPSPASTQTAPKSPAPPNLTRKRRWLYRLLAMTLVPLLLLVLLEIGLRIGGYGYSTQLFIDSPQVDQGKVWFDNVNFGQWVFPPQLEPKPRPIHFVMPKDKAKATCRVLVLGESAAMGFPDPSINFARVLECLLRAQYPNTKFEVINTAMVAINSHVARQIALQCADLQPDLLVVHLGNNEVIGPFGAAGVLGPFAPNLGLIRFSLAMKSTRLGQLLGNLMQKISGTSTKPIQWKGMSTFVNSRLAADDQRLERIRNHFRENLKDICQVGIALKVPVIVCTIPVNLRDCAPFGSQHRAPLDAKNQAAWDQAYQTGIQLENEKKWAQAIANYDVAMKIDNGHADLAYRLGRCWAAQGNDALAQQYFTQARDLDVLRFRTDTALNQIIREVAASGAAQGVQLADAEKSFAQASPHALPGFELFLEHVHMTFKGNYVLGRTVFETMMQAPPAVLPKAKEPPVLLTEEQCRQRLAYSERSEWKITDIISDMYQRQPPFVFQLDNAEQAKAWREKLAAQKNRLIAGGMERSLLLTQNASLENPSDWMLHMKLGDILAESNRVPDAIKEFRKVVSLVPQNHGAHYMLGNLEAANRQWEAAKTHYRTAMELEENYLEAYVGLANVYEQQRQLADAEEIYKELNDKHPGRAYVLDQFGCFLYRIGRVNDAKARFAEAIAIEPDHIGAHVSLAMTARQLGQIDEAIKHLEITLKLQPNDSEIKAVLDQLYKQQKSSGNKAP